MSRDPEDQTGRGDTPEEPVGEEPAEEHRPDGLDLARSVVRGQRRVDPTGLGGPGAGGAPGRRRRGAAGAAGAGGAGGPGTSRQRRGGRSGAHPDDRDPQPLGSELDRLVSRRGWELDLRVQEVFGRWAELVGADVGAHSTPESLHDGRLVVRTDSTAWATQLTLLAPAVVRRLNEELGDGTVSVIDVQGPLLPTWRKGPRSARDGRGPRDTYG